MVDVLRGVPDDGNVSTGVAVRYEAMAEWASRELTFDDCQVVLLDYAFVSSLSVMSREVRQRDRGGIRS